MYLAKAAALAAFLSAAVSTTVYAAQIDIHTTARLSDFSIGYTTRPSTGVYGLAVGPFPNPIDIGVGDTVTLTVVLDRILNIYPDPAGYYEHFIVILSGNIPDSNYSQGTLEFFNGTNSIQTLSVDNYVSDHRMIGSASIPSDRVLSFDSFKEVYINNNIAPTQITKAGFGYTSSFLGVPEIATWAMMVVGFGGLAAAIRRGRAKLLPAKAFG